MPNNNNNNNNNNSNICGLKCIKMCFLELAEHSRESLLKKVKSKADQNKLTFINTYYLVFQNVRNILQELRILLTPDKDHKKVFQDILVVGFRNGKSLKDQLVRAKLLNAEITGRSESCGKGKCQVCYLICDTLFLPKLVVRRLNFKVGYLTVTLRRSFIS